MKFNKLSPPLSYSFGQFPESAISLSAYSQVDEEVSVPVLRRCAQFGPTSHGELRLYTADGQLWYYSPCVADLCPQMPGPPSYRHLIARRQTVWLPFRSAVRSPNYLDLVARFSRDVWGEVLPFVDEIFAASGHYTRNLRWHWLFFHGRIHSQTLLLPRRPSRRCRPHYRQLILRSPRC